MVLSRWSWWTPARAAAVAVMAVMAFGLQTAAHGAVLVQRVAPQASEPGLALSIWYPSSAAVARQAVSGLHPTVALSGPIMGRGLPLILISHGAGGTGLSHYDTAAALAAAGFVVVAVNHTGDAYGDQSRAGFRINLIDRPRQASRAIDYMLHEWSGRDRLDSSRIGMFGFSLGGFTTLVSIGGSPDLGRVRELCAQPTTAPDCAFIQSRHGDQLDPGPLPATTWVHDRRIKAAVIAAPAASFDFGPGSLAAVKVPVELWTAENDQMAPARWNSDLVRRELPSPPEAHVVPKADHGVFLTPEICSPGVDGFDCERFHKEMTPRSSRSSATTWRAPPRSRASRASASRLAA
jgi:predicted dienelactone hydrolase